ncbi:unnamed protein product [Closterium sp. NIES-54]
MLLSPEGDPDALAIPIPYTHAEAVSGPWASYWKAAEEGEMASYRSTGTYVDAVPPFGVNVVSGMWLYKMKRLLGSPPMFKARYVASGFRQCKGVDFFHTFGLVLRGKQPVTLTGFSDSWADDTELLRSRQSYYFSLGTGAVSWRSTRASSVSSSSCEAKVYTVAMATQELRWLSFLLTDLGERPHSPPVLFANNTFAILLCEEPQLVGKAKHIQLRYFLL